jgi:hypothetical protein
MRGRIALQSCCRAKFMEMRLPRFAQALGVRARPRAAFRNRLDSEIVRHFDSIGFK